MATAQPGFEPVSSTLRRVVGATATVDPHEEQALATNIQAQLSALPTAIGSHEDYARAKASLPVLKRAEDAVVGFFKDMKKAAYDAHRTISTKESEQLKPITVARQSISGLIYRYEQEQEAERRRLQRDAEERERARLEQQALDEAAALSASAPAMAEQIVEQAIAAPAPVVSLPTAKVDVAGVTTRENWQFLYDGASPGQKWKDLTDTQRQRVLQLIPREYLMPDEVAIGRVVKAMKSGAKIPGIRVHDAGSTVVRA